MPRADDSAEVARRLGVTPATLRRWVDGRDRAADGDGAGRPPRSRTRASSRGCASAATRSTRSARRREPAGSPSATSRTCSRPPTTRYTLEEAAEETGLEPALIERIWTAAGLLGRRARAASTEDDLQLLRYVAAVLAAGFPLVAFLQLVRVYGQAIAQIADAEVRLFHLYVHEPLMRDGVPGPRDGRGDGGPGRASCCRSPRRSWTTSTSASSQHFVEQDVIGHMEADLDEGARARPPARGDRLRRPRGLHAADRGGGRGGGGRRGRALRRGRRGHAARRRARDQDDRRRGDGRRLRPGGAHRLGRRLPGSCTTSARCRGSASTTARRSTATATTTAARSTSPRASARARRAARCWSRAPVVDGAGPHLEFEPIGEVRLKGFSEATELFLARPSEAG